MILFIASIIRKLSFLFLSYPLTYYPGMVIIKVGRFFRKITFNNQESPRFHAIKMFNSININVDRFSYMGGSIFWTGFHHVNEALFLKKYLKSNMTFVDIGANQGEFSLIAASILKAGRVISFEPVTYQRTLLDKNKMLNNFSNLEIHPFGLSNKESKMPIYTSNDTSLHHGIHEGLSTLYSSGNRTQLQEIIELKVFDDLFYSKMNRLDFIKIDIEGAELFALQGMKKSLTKYQPLILIEINEDTFNSAGYTTDELISFFDELNYKFYKIDKGRLSKSPITIFNAWGNYIAKYTA
jgi:FkbM family methyltransferase